MKEFTNYGWFKFKDLDDTDERVLRAQLLGRDFSTSQVEELVEKARKGWKFRFQEPPVSAIALMEP